MRPMREWERTLGPRLTTEELSECLSMLVDPEERRSRLADDDDFEQVMAHHRAMHEAMMRG